MKIFAVGMNYLQHNEELHGKTFKPSEPVIFLKPDSSLLRNSKPFFVPDDLGRIDYEGELVVRICKLGKSVPLRFARRYYDAVTVGIDFTAREMQSRLRSAGHPWELSKGFDGAAAIGDWQPLAPDDTLDGIHFRLDINGKTVQKGCSDDMLYSTDEIIAYVSRFFTLKTGDLLFTGTPAGVGPVDEGDNIEGFIGEQRVLTIPCR